MNSALNPSRFGIGVTGHRVPPKLPNESLAPIRSLLDNIFAEITGTAKFIVVSSVAEGSDRIVADAGLAAGFALEIILPFSRREYARDFETQTSRVEYERLLARASIVVEMDGVADQRPPAYEAAGVAMLETIDLLITIWDGQGAAGVGGTAHIVERAIGNGIIVVWIEPANPGALKLSWSGIDGPTAKSQVRPRDTFRPAGIALVARAVKDVATLRLRSSQNSR